MKGKLKKCNSCSIYTLKDYCPKCKKETSSAHYRFSKIKNAPPRSKPFKRR
jgi:rRNA maturation protein Nop10